MSKPVKNINKTPTEGALKKALISLMYEKPFATITVKEICEKAGIYRSTFYSHYKCPEELMQAIQDEVVSDFLKFADRVRANKMTVMESGCAFLSYVKDNDFTLRLLFVKDPAGPIASYISEGITSQLVSIFKPFHDPLKDQYLPTFQAYGMMAAVTKWMRNDYDTPVDELANLLFNTQAVLYREMSK